MERVCEQRRLSGKHGLAWRSTDFIYNKPEGGMYYDEKYKRFFDMLETSFTSTKQQFLDDYSKTIDTRWSAQAKWGGYQTALSALRKSSSVYDIYTAPTSKYNYLMPKHTFEKLNQIDFEPGRTTPVFIVHPVEGHVNMLKDFGKYIYKYPVYGIQFTDEALKYETVEELADYYWSAIMKEFPFVDRVHLCGVTFGASIAYEMAIKYPTKVLTLSFLDGSYKYGPKPYDRMIKPDMDVEWLYQFVSQYGDVKDAKKFWSALRQFGTVDERIKYAVGELMAAPRFNFHPYDIELAAKAYVKKMKMAYLYEPTGSLKLPEVLAVFPYDTRTENDLDGWSKYFGGKFTAKPVYCDKREFFESAHGEQVARFLNEHLIKWN
jgi:pimeloyl-ACP methyl ester carboxylesterase